MRLQLAAAARCAGRHPRGRALDARSARRQSTGPARPVREARAGLERCTMYTITKGPSKLVAQRRTGPTQQQVESRLGELLKGRHPTPPTPPPPRAQPPGPWPLSRLVFNRVNGRRPPATAASLEGTQETYTLAHEENVRFVSEAWQQVERQLGAGQAGGSGPRPVQYVERTPNPRLQSFVPIDLDEWWAQQFLARVTSCS
ncbi:MAPK regulated corepressor interacting protein 2 [Galemys pyrenaicus]|uniref:MAPK regulated corepressor interacting protein 2 n=1 Tax=Galemys pyrenaicus TaxID=202257 RepID=A0A8J5ZIT1_GALPY|nr:MAPK regulated corepressor interacting protein 2 [Galemys pyrenaicus]